MKKELKDEEHTGVTYTSFWTALPDPVHYVECPNPKCKQIILMSKPTTLDLLKRWVKKFKKGK